MRPGSLRTRLLFCIAVLALTSARAEPARDLENRIDSTIDTLKNARWEETISGTRLSLILGGLIILDECQSYPYHDNRHGSEGFSRLASDLRAGLRQGLQCMAGNGPDGVLHPWHAENARRLVNLLNDDTVKTLSCVEDETFAYAVAYPARSAGRPNEILIDTYRISGFLSRRFDRDTYRDFFNMSEPLIEDHLTGKPLHLDGMHRYRNLPALMFHEVTHWLGYEHTNLAPDVVDLYEICCFGGSEHIDDAETNRRFQAEACKILKDTELWDANETIRKQLWDEKGYFRLKRDIRQASG